MSSHKMACVILPSETARLVYGYLVKENLNDIALQFLESSPYLMDCCQIVKSGFQFNTKLMGKDLPELLQEYSVIHNLVNNKVRHLCRSSLLYKRIKLRCESLPEILELILFWKYKNSKSEVGLSNSDKNPNDISVSTNCEYLNLNDVSQNKISENASDSTCFNSNNSTNPVQKDCAASEGYHSKLHCENYFISREAEEHERSSTQISKTDVCNVDNKKQEKDSLFSVQSSNDVCSVRSDEVNLEKHKSHQDTNANASSITTASAVVTTTTTSSSSDNIDNSSNTDYNNDNNSNNDCQSESKLNNNQNILSIDVDPQCEDLVNSDMSAEPLVPNTEPNKFDNPIKIVGIQEENQSENHSLGVFSKPLEGEEGNMNLANSSVVFVSPDVGNVTIGQEQSQIIVIPFDYYKAPNTLQNGISVESNKKFESNKNLGLMSNEVDNQPKNNLIFDEETRSAASSSISPLFRNEGGKISAADGNIITESDFLKNSHLMYNLEKELFKPEQPSQVQLSKESKEKVIAQTVSAPLVVVSQPLPRPARYRAILPKKEDPVQMYPLVVVQPLLENNKDLKEANSTKIEKKVRREGRRRVKKKCTLFQKKKAKEYEEPESFKGLSSETVIEGEVKSEVKAEILQVNLASDKEVTSERTNEEKENLEKTENKKNETPVFFTKRNSKRLSLSTPRRRSHIRALEFETPPKTNKEKKKSKTSPKVKVEQVKVERKSVRNTLFKSPTLEDTFKSPVLTMEKRKLQPHSTEPLKPVEEIEPLNELSIPIATRSPNTKLSEAWETLTGVGCVIGQNDSLKTSPAKKMWDADLRCFILENTLESESLEKRRIRKPEKNPKDNRKSTKKKIPPAKRIKPIPVTVSPSKISLTAKRNTYSINGNEEGSPIRTLIDDLKIVTPFKDTETVRPTEETPLTKLLRENINTIDIDLSMINTPSFPPTPSILITPDLDDASLTGTNYYSPTKDCSKDKVIVMSDSFEPDSEKTNKKETKEMHEKVIDDLVSKAKEIIGLSKEVQENSMMRRPSGKILSMVKIQMLTQCDKKLMENIPINEETTFSNQTIIGNVIKKTTTKTDLKVELEEKRKRALRKIKVVKENFCQSKNRVTKRGRKRKRSGNSTKSDKSKTDISKESVVEEEDLTTEKSCDILHSTPYPKRDFDECEKSDSDRKIDDKVLQDIRQQFPPFHNDSKKLPELSLKSRKKLHYVENFLKLEEIVKFIDDFSENNAPRLYLSPSLRRFFYVFYKWLKHPHKRELNASLETNALLKKYLSMFEKVNMGLHHNNKKFKRDYSTPKMSETPLGSLKNNLGCRVSHSDEDEREHKRRSEKRKDEDAEDGVVSTLPLKKRKSTVQQVENKTVLTSDKNDTKNSSSENVSQTQNFLQDIDVDRFLSQIHGQETR